MFYKLFHLARLCIGLGFAISADAAFGVFIARGLAYAFDKQLTWLEYAVAAIIALLPDFLDVGYQALIQKRVTGAHKSVPHKPLFMIPAATLAAMIVCWYWDLSALWIWLTPLALIAHLVHDSIEQGPGIEWGYPFGNGTHYYVRNKNGVLCWTMTPAEIAHQYTITMRGWIEREYLHLTVNLGFNAVMMVIALVVIFSSKPPLF